MSKRNSKLISVVSADHNEKLITGLWNAFKAQNKVDLLLMEWGNKSLVAHQVVADVFLSSSKLLGGALTDIAGSPDDLMSNAELLLEFLYTGRVSVGVKQLNGLLEMAKELDFEDLIEALESSAGILPKTPIAKQEPVARGRDSLRRKQSKPSKVLQPRSDEEEEEEEEEFLPQPAKKKAGSKSVGLPYAPPLKLKPTKPKLKRQPRKSSEEAVIRRGRPAKVAGSAAVKQCKWPDCDFVYEDRADLKQHRLTHLHKCEHCSFANSKKSQVDAHNKKVHLQIRPFICETCGFAAFSQYQLVQHNRTHTGERPYICDVCGKAFADPSTFAKHAKVHEANLPRPFACDICSFCSHRKDAYTFHMKTVHGPSNKRSLVRQKASFKCRHCSFVSDRQAYITRHVRAVHGPTACAFSCDQCEYTGRSSINMKKHRRIHTGERPFVCADCGFAFRDASTRKRHRLRHCKPHAEKPFACPACDRTFFLLRYLKAHLKTDHETILGAPSSIISPSASGAPVHPGPSTAVEPCVCDEKVPAFRPATSEPVPASPRPVSAAPPSRNVALDQTHNYEKYVESDMTIQVQIIGDDDMSGNSVHVLDGYM